MRGHRSIHFAMTCQRPTVFMLVSMLAATIILFDILATGHADSQPKATKCFVNKKLNICSVTMAEDNLELQVGNTQKISVERRGHCRTRRENGVISRSCNVKLGLENDFVYGLIVRSSTTGITISSPRLEIKIPGFKLSEEDL